MTQCIILNGSGGSHTRKIIGRTLGPYRVATALGEAGYSSQIIDFINDFTVEELCQALDQYLTPDTLWVGISSTFVYPQDHTTNVNNVRTRNYGLETMYHHSYDDMLVLFEYIRSRSRAKIIYGGARSQFFTIDPKVDYYVFGNADVAIVDLTRYLSGQVDHIQHVQNIMIEGQPCQAIDSTDYPEPTMDRLSTQWWLPQHHVLPQESLPIELARGCIFKCKFCSFHLTGKKKGTYVRDMAEIRDDMIRIYEATGTTNYWFVDDTFNDDNDKIDALHRMITSLPFKIQFTCYLRIDLINRYPHQAELLKEMGLIGTFFGVETFQPDSARAIGKGLAPNRVKDRLYWLEDQWRGRVNIETAFILGLPYDTHEYFYDLIRWCMEADNPVQCINFTPLSLYYYNKSRPEWDKYASEFSLHPDIYGYQVEEGRPTSWRLPSQNLDYATCHRIANQFNDLREPRNMLSGLTMPSMLNVGVTHDVMMTSPMVEIQRRHPFQQNGQQMIDQYKQLIFKGPPQ